MTPPPVRPCISIIFMGTGPYAARMLEWTVENGFDVHKVVCGFKKNCRFVGPVANRLGLSVINQNEAEKFCEQTDISLAVSCLYRPKIKEPLISKPRLGCINFHPAPLPDLKGTGGYNLALLGKLSEYGASAHFVDDNYDTGKIIEVFKFSFDWRIETALSLEQKTKNILCDLYKSVMLDILHNGKITRPVKENIGGTYLTKRQMLDLMQIDPEQDDIDLKIRAFWFPPHNGAYVKINGVKYTLINEFILRQISSKLS